MFVSRALSAVDYPKASSSALACYKWLHGTAVGAGESSGIDRLRDVPGFRGCGTVEKASPKCREAAVSEVRYPLATPVQQQKSFYSRKIGDSTYAFLPSS